jgi:hypothetical protein
VVGFNPSFLFASALVSNDVPLAAFCSVALLVCSKLLSRALSPDLKSFSLLGLVIALGLLVKTTALGLIPLGLAVGVWLAIQTRRDPLSSPQGDLRRGIAPTRILLNALAGILVPPIFLTGWWFARNLVLYGDPMAYRLVFASAIFPRDLPLTWAELFQINLPWLWQTFWGGPTPGDFAPPLLVILLALTLFAGRGAVLSFVSSRDNNTRAILALLALWLTFIFGAQVEFIRTSGGTDQGRYLFPAIGSFAILWVAGLNESFSRLGLWVNRHLGDRASITPRAYIPILSIACILAFLALALIVLFANTIPAYARPPESSAAVLTHAERQLDANFSNALALRGYSLSRREVRRGDSLRVTLYWQSLAPMRESYRVFVHLLDAKGHVAGGKDVVPEQGAYATVLWQPGEWIEDTITLTTARDALPGVYQLEIGLYPYGRPDDRMNLEGSAEDRVLLDAIEVRD